MAESLPAPRPERYVELDRRNRESWYLQDANRPFSVYMSVHSAGAARVPYNRFTDDSETVASLKHQNQLGRFLLGGNMSTVADAAGVQYGPEHLSNEDRIQDAQGNIRRFLDQLSIDPATVRLLNPQRDYSQPMQPLNVDTYDVHYDGREPSRMPDRSDFMYSYDPSIVLAVRPADCPVIVFSGSTPKGQLNGLIHCACQGSAMDQMRDIDRCLDELEVDRDSTRLYITPGGQAETYDHVGGTLPVKERFPVTDGLLYPTEPQTTNTDIQYGFRVDTPYYVYDGLRQLGFSEYQIFSDTSDTTHPASGFASHSRATRLGESNVRDLVVAQFEPLARSIASNPERPTPPEIEKTIVPIEVAYVDFDGNERTGTIEVARDLASDVKDFFRLARKIEFPIERVMRSSDADVPWSDAVLMEQNVTSGFNYRTIAGTDTVSLHGQGRAFDLNPRLNPYMRFHDNGTVTVEPEGALYTPGQPGVLDTHHPLVLFMKSRGWEWGGDWTVESGRIDYQHFQKPL